MVKEMTWTDWILFIPICVLAMMLGNKIYRFWWANRPPFVFIDDKRPTKEEMIELSMVGFALSGRKTQ